MKCPVCGEPIYADVIDCQINSVYKTKKNGELYKNAIRHEKCLCDSSIIVGYHCEKCGWNCIASEFNEYNSENDGE